MKAEKMKRTADVVYNECFERALRDTAITSSICGMSKEQAMGWIQMRLWFYLNDALKISLPKTKKGVRKP